MKDTLVDTFTELIEQGWIVADDDVAKNLLDIFPFLSPISLILELSMMTRPLPKLLH